MRAGETVDSNGDDRDRSVGIRATAAEGLGCRLTLMALRASVHGPGPALSSLPFPEDEGSWEPRKAQQDWPTLGLMLRSHLGGPCCRKVRGGSPSTFSPAHPGLGPRSDPAA
jgi:hypothetical protein